MGDFGYLNFVRKNPWAIQATDSFSVRLESNEHGEL
jgi:hypothetical protein